MGPILLGRVAVQERIALRRAGYGFFQINSMMNHFDQTLLHAAVAEADMVKPGAAAAFYKIANMEQPVAVEDGTPDADPTKPPKVRAFGDGSLLKRLIEAWEKFADSELGKMVIEALKKLLIGFLVI